jgi:branched-chain amino acid transport system permease protein
VTAEILQYVISGITIGSIYALVALGFNFIFNTTDIINFAQGEFVVFGGLIMVSLVSFFKLPLIVGFFVTVFLVMVIGVLFHRLTIQPLKDSPIITMIICTIGVSVLLRGMMMVVWGKASYPMPNFSGENPLRFWGATILPQTLWVIGITLVLVLLLGLFFKTTLTGKAMRACAIDKTAASLMGIKVKQMIMFSFALSAAFGAIGGIVITPISLMDFGRGPMLALKGFSALVLGGLGSPLGAVVAGFLIGVVEALGAGLISSGFKDALSLVILLLVLYIRPSGIFGMREA